MKRHIAHFIALTVIGFTILLFSTCSNNTQRTGKRGAEYAGSQKCMACHKNLYDTYAGTAHNLTSRPARKDAIKGSFAPGRNRFYYQPAVKVNMEQRESGFYQVAYAGDTIKEAHRFDLVFGSATKGQTYAYWQNGNIFQLPVSYFTPADSWVNSPGYPSRQPKFDRPVPVGCFECHSSYIKEISPPDQDDRPANRFDSSQLVYGIDCERCHGPAARHVSFHEQHPQDRKPHFITLVSALHKQQQLDMCAICHSGVLHTRRSVFGFAPGDTLANFVRPDMYASPTANIDVHGKQYQLLSRSKCFLRAELTCASCHNTHATERGNLALFSARCMNCHNTASHNFCTVAPALGNAIKRNCIDCHMPARPSGIITMLAQNNKEPTPAFVRTHFITVYPEETKKFMAAGK